MWNAVAVIVLLTSSSLQLMLSWASVCLCNILPANFVTFQVTFPHIQDSTGNDESYPWPVFPSHCKQQESTFGSTGEQDHFHAIFFSDHYWSKIFCLPASRHRGACLNSFFFFSQPTFTQVPCLIGVPGAWRRPSSWWAVLAPQHTTLI